MAHKLTPESWLDCYVTLKTDVKNLRSAGVITPEDRIKNLSSRVKILSDDLRELRKINAATVQGIGLSLGELSRRETILENIRKQLPLMSADHFLHSGGSNSNNSNNNNAGKAIEMHDVISPLSPSSSSSSGTTNLTDRGLQQRQQEVIKEQDATLFSIAKGMC